MRSLAPALFLLAACTASEAPVVELPPEARASWLAEAVLEPDAFEALTAASREGWVSLHASDLDGAVSHFEQGTTGERRALLARSLVYADLAAITDIAVWRTLREWDRHELDASGTIDGLVPIWRRCGGPDRLSESVRRGRGLPYDGTVLPGWAEERVAAYGGDAETLRSLATEPILQQGNRIVRDPCAYAFLASHDDPAPLLDTLAATEGLAARFLGPAPTAADLLAEAARPVAAGAVGARSPSLPPMHTVDLSTLQADVRALDDYLAHERERLTTHAPDAGLALMVELGLVGRLRQEVLVARSRELMNEQPTLALTLADIAWDATDRSIGSKNSAGAASTRARALLLAGRTRAALDALEPLVAAWPQATGAREWVADLAVLEGLERTGDSKEE